MVKELWLEEDIQKRETKETLKVNHKDNVEGFLRHEESRMIPLVMIKNNKVIKTARNSKEMAEYIVKNKLIVGTKESTIARSIRSRLHDNKSYKGYYFQRLEDIELI